MTEPKYYFSIGAIFKNEALGIKEWIEHYIFHGVDHIYLLNDDSNDKYKEIIEPYIEKGIVTLIDIEFERIKNRQSLIYNKYLLPILNNKITRWLLICDLDEFVWSPRDVDLKNILKQCERLGQVQMDCDHYGSNGLEKQPKYIVPNFTRRAEFLFGEKNHRNFKYFVNSDFKFKGLGVHMAYFEDPSFSNGKYFQRIDYFTNKEYPWLVVNHYSRQSLDFWVKIKMTRGDADEYRTRTLDNFFDYSDNDNKEVDLRLYEQNKPLYEKLLKESGDKIDDRYDL